jgi:alpha-glucosidase
VDGFRLDTANYYCHDRTLADNPPQPPEKRGNIPAAMQIHLHNICQPETVAFMERVRSLLDSFKDRMAVAEIGSAHSLERMIEYTQGTHRLHTAYSFLLLGEQPSPKHLVELNAPWQNAEGATAWPSWAMSNHDVQRVASRWAQGDTQRAQQLLMLLACLRGTLFIYQGEELGLTESEVAFDYIQDPFGKAHWPRNKGRDGCRTPFPWDSHALHGGFTKGAPWLPMDAANLQRAVSTQESDADSTLQLTRKLLSLRRLHPAFRHGDFQCLHADDSALVLLRAAPEDSVLCAFNFSADTVVVTLPRSFTAREEMFQLGAVQVLTATLEMQPWSARLLQVSP